MIGPGTIDVATAGAILNLGAAGFNTLTGSGKHHQGGAGHVAARSGQCCPTDYGPES